MKSHTVTLPAFVLSAGLAMTFPSGADTQVDAGLLTCSVEGGAGFVVGSSKDMNCVFDKTKGGTERYIGEINKFGLDIGSTKETTIKWLVVAPSTGIGDRSLAGNYGGLSAEASAGYGIGANAMIGGSDKSIILQPFSGQIQEGVNLALGVGTMTLR